DLNTDYITAPFGTAFLTSSNAPAAYTTTVVPDEQSDLFAFLDEASGLTNDTLMIQIDPGTLWVGIYYNTVEVTVDGVIDPVDLVVALNLTAMPDPGEFAFVSPSEIYFAAALGSEVIQASAVWLNSSNGPAPYTASLAPSGTAFTFLSNPSGMTNDSVAILVDPSGMIAEGSYVDTVLFTIDGIAEVVPLTVHLLIDSISNPPDTGSGAGVTPADLYFSAPLGADVVQMGAVHLNSDNDPAAYSSTIISGGTQFTALLNPTGMTGDSIFVQVNPALMSSVGLYDDTVLFTIDGVSEDVMLAVHLEITSTAPGETAWLSPPNGISLTMEEGAQATDSFCVVLSSSNAPAVFTIEYAHPPTFVSIPFSGSLTNKVICGSVDVGSLTVGDYADTVIFNVDGVDNNPLLMIVSLTVTPADSGGGGGSEIWVTPAEQWFETPVGTELNDVGAVYVGHNLGSQAYSVEIVDNADFVTLTQINDSGVYFDVYASAGMAPGGYVDSLLFIFASVADSLWSIVHLSVIEDTSSGPPFPTETAEVSPGTLSFQAVVGSTGLQTESVWVSSTNAPANWCGFVLGGPFSFAFVPDSIGVTDDSVAIAVNPTGLDVGIYTDTVVFDVVGTESSVLVEVTLEVIVTATNSVALGNYPNPFNPTTTIHFDLPTSSQVTLTIYNVLGREVARLVDSYYPAGEHQVEWNATDASSGVYFYRIQTENFAQSKKMVLLK
ncbi:MAG: T9SS type A sorting domain-containing protein, partial [candidate division Zixibacteria bacterium]